MFVDLHGDSAGLEGSVDDAVYSLFPFKPREIIEQLNLRRPIYRSTATYGHFGRPQFTWEAIDRAADLRRMFSS